MLKSKSLNTKRFINLIAVLVVVVLVLINLVCISTLITSRYNSIHLLVVILLLYVLNIITYFFSIYQSSKYTSSIKFFWIRVFNIIWYLEFYLFIICIFIYIISPSELKIYIDVVHQIKPQTPNINSNLNYILIIISVVLLNTLSVSNQYLNIFKKNIVLFIITLTSTYIFLCEFKMYYYYAATSLYSDLKLFINKNNGYYDGLISLNNDVVEINIFNKKINSEKKYLQPYIFLLNLILCIKFIHVFLIVLINFIFILISISRNNKLLLETIGMWQQNLIILLIFWALNYLIFFKYLYKFITYGFYSNINITNLINQQKTMIDEFFLL